MKKIHLYYKQFTVCHWLIQFPNRKRKQKVQISSKMLLLKANIWSVHNLNLTG